MLLCLHRQLELAGVTAIQAWGTSAGSPRVEGALRPFFCDLPEDSDRISLEMLSELVMDALRDGPEAVRDTALLIASQQIGVAIVLRYECDGKGVGEACVTVSDRSNVVAIGGRFEGFSRVSTPIRINFLPGCPVARKQQYLEHFGVPSDEQLRLTEIPAEATGERWWQVEYCTVQLMYQVPLPAIAVEGAG